MDLLQPAHLSSSWPECIARLTRSQLLSQFIQKNLNNQPYELSILMRRTIFLLRVFSFSQALKWIAGMPLIRKNAYYDNSLSCVSIWETDSILCLLYKCRYCIMEWSLNQNEYSRAAVLNIWLLRECIIWKREFY